MSGAGAGAGGGVFKGFTDQDIQKLNNTNKDVPAKPLVKKGILKSKPSPHTVTIRKMPGEQRVEILDSNARLSKPAGDLATPPDGGNPVNELPNDTKEPETVETSRVEEEHKKVESIVICGENLPRIITSAEYKEIDIREKPHNDVVFQKRINLEEFEKTQKIIEEQNRKRKEMLAKALEDRSKKTAEEVEKINIIKKELQSLDNQLSDDVSILRKKIEKACLTYYDAEKTYFRVEKEFLNAKITLQKERERKELLTEHLCTLIAHNEARKAKKLESLMDQLVYDDAVPEKPSGSPIPFLCDGVCEKTGKILEIDNGRAIQRDDD